MNKYLDIKIYPSQSLSRKGFRILILIFLIPACLIGTFFSLLGAWPVAGFMGLELVLIYFAFKIYLNNSKVYERIVLDDKNLRIKYYNQEKIIKTITLEPTWLKVHISNNNIPSNILSLRSHGKENFVGMFLSPREKVVIAEKIRTGLNKWKNRYI